MFFETHTASVEIIFQDNNIYRVYFTRTPESFCLTDDMKEQFHNQVTRDTDKSKLKDLVTMAPEIIEELEHEARLNKFFNKYRLIALLVSHIGLWKKIAFSMTLLLNFFIISSYFDTGEGNWEERRF